MRSEIKTNQPTNPDASAGTCSDTLSPEMDPILEYFEKSYIGTLRHNGQRRTPLFTPLLWNVHDSTLQNEDRTNYSQEGWHRKFSSTIDCHHPTIWKFLDGIFVEQAMMEQCVERENAGHEAPKKRRKYEDKGLFYGQTEYN